MPAANSSLLTASWNSGVWAKFMRLVPRNRPALMMPSLMYSSRPLFW